MYQEIHNTLFENLKARKDFRLSERRLNIGMALKQLKNNNRIPVRQIIRSSGLKRSNLDTFIHVGEVNTSAERFEKLLQALNVSSDEFIRIARETARYNFYHLTGSGVPRLNYKTHEVEIYSPPSFSRKDFFWCLIRIFPGKGIRNLRHETMDQVAGLVTNGHLHLEYGGKSYSIHANQTFLFDPKVKHDFTNQADSGTTEFYLLYQLKRESRQKDETRGRKVSPSMISTATLIRRIRKELSPNPDRLLPLTALSDISGISRDALAHLSFRHTKIIPFEKIDLLANLTDDSFENIIQKSENRYQGWIRVFTEDDKTTINLSMRHGVCLTNYMGIGLGKRKFSVADATFESWEKGGTRKEWNYEGTGFIGIAVQRGHLGVQYGTQPLQALKWGHYLYVNAGVPLRLVNLLSEEEAYKSGESKEAKILLFSFPPIA